MYSLLSYFALYRRHKWMLVLGIALAVVTLLANVGLLMLSGWFLSASSLAGIAGICNFNYMLPSAGVRIASIIRTVGRYFERLISHDVTFCILQNLRVDTFSKLFPLFPAKLMLFRQGDLLNRIVTDVDILNNFYLRVFLPIISSYIVVIVVTFCVSSLDKEFSLVLCGAMLFITFTLSPLFYYVSKPISKNINSLRDEYRHQLTIWLQNQAELIIFGASDYYRAQMEKTELSWYKMQQYQHELVFYSKALMILICNFTVLTLLWMTSDKIYNNSQLSTLITIFVFCILAMIEVLTPAISAFHHLSNVISSTTLITQIVKQKPEICFTNEYSEIPLQIALYLNKVSFIYTGQLQNTLTDITLSIDPGSRIAILGHTGCGKSTLLQLLTRAWDPQQGIITINNTPLKLFSEKTLRASISVVPQRVYLFSATLRDNLLLSSPNASDRKLFSILKKVGLNKLTSHGSLNDWLGDGGRQLSGGELRRLAIARALLHDAPLILLDEPTEGLDVDSEKQILELLMETTCGKTLLIATHKLRRLNKFNKIIVMDNGRIIHQCSYEKLCMISDYYG